MKNIFRFLMAAAVMFGAVACSQSDEIQEVVGGEEVVSVLSLELEDLGTRLAGDASKIDRVAWGIYDEYGNFLAPHSSANKGVADFKGGKAEIEVRLFTGKVYDLVFFAYCSANEAYSIDWGARQLNVSYKVNEQQQNDLANLEARDAFFHIENRFVAGPSKTFTLKRPFAQLNAGQSMVDYDNMQLTQNCIIKSQLTTEAYAAMDLKTGKVIGEKVPVVLDMNKVIDLNEDGANDHLLVGKEPNVTEYKHLAMNYLLVDEKELVDVKLNLLGNEGTNFEREYFNVPLQRNYRTNILGSLISEPSLFTIVIDAKFDGDHTAAVDPETSALEGILAPLYNQETAHVALQQNVTWTTGASHGSTPLIPADSKLKELVIEGTNITRDGVQPTITFIGKGVGPVRAANGGKIIFRNVKIVDESVSYNEGAWELGYLEMAGNLEFENCTFVNAVMVCGGSGNNDTPGDATFKNCYFNSNDANQYAAWVSGLKATFVGCTFEGARGLKAHEQYGPDVESLVVNNCDFTLTKKPGLAIGDVNAETAITIKNSTFSTQAGDQGLYIYESDTDVATFDLNLYNNTIVLKEPVSADSEALATLLRSNIQGVINVEADATAVMEYCEMLDGTDATINMNGAKITSGTPEHYGYIANGDVNLTINNADINANGGGIAVVKGAKVVFSGNVYVDTASTSGRYVFYTEGVGSELTINGGNFSWDPKDNTRRAYVYASEGTTVYIKGGTFGKASTRSGYTAGILGTGDVIITGGTFGFDPSAWVAPGYKAVKNGTTWTVEDAFVHSVAELDAAIKNGETTIYIGSGEYNIPASAKGKTLELIGLGNPTISVVPAGQGEANGQLDYNLDGATVTFTDLTIKTNNKTYAGYARLTATFNNCTMENCFCLNGNSVFNDCTLNVSGDQYNIWTWGAPVATFTDCTFNCDGKAMLLYGQANTKLTMNNCVFNDKGGLASPKKTAIEIGNDYNKSYELIVNNATVNGFEENPNGIATGTTLWSNKNSMGQDKLNVVIDGFDVY